MSIILEGPDLAGKTTLAKEIGWEILKFPDARGIDPCYTISMQIPPGQFVWDRWWFTEVVYSTLFRDYEGFSIAQLWQMALNAETQGATFLYCPPLTQLELKERYDKRGDFEHSMEDLIRIHYAYESMISLYTRFLPEILITKETAIADHVEKARGYEFLKDYTCWGSVLPGKVLFIGEDEYLKPYFKNEFFLEALDKTYLKPSDICIMDCFNEATGEYTDFQNYIQSYDPKCIIALGSSVAERLRAKKITQFYNVPCPVYWEKDRQESSNMYALRVQRVLDYDSKNLG